MKPSRRRRALQPSTGIDRAALLAPTRCRVLCKIERELQGNIVLYHANAGLNPLDAISALHEVE